MDEFTYLPDWNAQGDTTSNVSKIRFGDGYVQRQTKGMNPLATTWSLAFHPRDDATTDLIEAFLIARYGVIAFTWTPPGGGVEEGETAVEARRKHHIRDSKT